MLRSPNTFKKYHDAELTLEEDQSTHKQTTGYIEGHTLNNYPKHFHNIR